MDGPSTREQFLAKLREMQTERPLPGRLLFAKLWGSRSHNTNLDGSDWDLAGVYVVDTRSVLGLAPVKETVDKGDGEDLDYAFHEVGKLCNLLVKGNPGIIEMLFTERFTHEAERHHLYAAWAELVSRRRSFLTAAAVKQYMGFAQGQLRRMEGHLRLNTGGGTYNTKWAYHLIRLLGDALRIVTGNEPVVWKADGSVEHELLMNVRHGGLTPEQVAQRAAAMIAEIDALKPWPIPDEADKVWLDRWLVGLRLAELEDLQTLESPTW